MLLRTTFGAWQEDWTQGRVAREMQSQMDAQKTAQMCAREGRRCLTELGVGSVVLEAVS